MYDTKHSCKCELNKEIFKKLSSFWTLVHKSKFCLISNIRSDQLSLLTLKVYYAIYLVDEAIHASFCDHL